MLQHYFISKQLSNLLVPFRRLLSSNVCCIGSVRTAIERQDETAIQQQFVLLPTRFHKINYSNNNNIKSIIPVYSRRSISTTTTISRKNNLLFISQRSYYSQLHNNYFQISSLTNNLSKSYIIDNNNITKQQSLSTTASMVAIQQQNNPVQTSIENQLTTIFQPSYLEVINESHRHNVPKNSETHFKVVIVSETFSTTKSLIERHRMVNTALKEQLDGPVHALSIVAKTPKQWQDMQQKSGDGIVTIEPSPNCLGGDGSLPKR